MNVTESALNAPPPWPRGWFGRPPNSASIAFSLTATILFLIPGIYSSLVATRRGADHHYLAALTPGVFAVFLLSMASLAALTVLCPRPRISRTVDGFSVRPALLVSVLSGTARISGAAVVVALALAAVRSEPTDSGGRIVVGAALGALVSIAIVGFLNHRGNHQRRRWRTMATLSADGIAFPDEGRETNLLWTHITDVRVGPSRIRLRRLGTSQLYLYTARGGEDFPFVVDRYLLLGGSWLADTIRYHWQNPGAMVAFTHGA